MNPELAREYASQVGMELAAIGFNCNFAPTIDVARDTRWGRVYESLGEDPYLASAFSKALVEGMQRKGDLAACAKHFIGHGLSYTEFEYSDLQLPGRVGIGQSVEVSVQVKNVGEVDGCEVVQLYLRDIYASVTRPLKSLQAFARVDIKAGEYQTVHLSLTPRQLSLYDENLDFVQEAREIEVQIGDQAARMELIKPHQ